MGGNRKNGNITKGNKVKKGRRKVNQYGDFAEECHYGKIYRLVGGKHIEVKLANPTEDGKTIVTCRIKGKMCKKVWFKPDQYVIISPQISDNIYEIDGRVPESDLNRVQRMFEQNCDGEDIGVQIGGDENDVEEDHDDMILGIKATTILSTNILSKDELDKNESGQNDDISDQSDQVDQIEEGGQIQIVTKRDDSEYYSDSDVGSIDIDDI
jgi:translation initiation factor IF-1